VTTAIIAGSGQSGAELRIRSPVVSAGTSGDVSISYRSKGAEISGLQCDLAYDPSNILIAAATPGSAALTAEKSVQTAVLPNGDLRVLVVGFNQNILLDGDVISLKVQVSASAPRGRHALTCQNAVAVTPSGKETEVDVKQGGIIVGP